MLIYARFLLYCCVVFSGAEKNHFTSVLLGNIVYFQANMLHFQGSILHFLENITYFQAMLVGTSEKKMNVNKNKKGSVKSQK